MVALLEEGLEHRGDRRAKVMHDIPDYHATPVDAAEVANEAGVKLLVYTHIVPRLPNALAERVFLRGVSGVRSEGVTLGYDGLYLELPAGSDKIVERDLR
jgi:ribonuclease Z